MLLILISDSIDPCSLGLSSGPIVKANSDAEPGSLAGYYDLTPDSLPPFISFSPMGHNEIVF